VGAAGRDRVSPGSGSDKGTVKRPATRSRACTVRSRKVSRRQTSWTPQRYSNPCPEQSDCWISEQAANSCQSRLAPVSKIVRILPPISGAFDPVTRPEAEFRETYDNPVRGTVCRNTDEFPGHDGTYRSFLATCKKTLEIAGLATSGWAETDLDVTKPDCFGWTCCSTTSLGGR
jgi:hypothetical protein